MKLLGQEPETTEEALERQRRALESVVGLRDELAETAPAKMVKGFLMIGAALVVAYWFVGRR